MLEDELYFTISCILSIDGCVAQCTFVQCNLSLEGISIHTQLNTKKYSNIPQQCLFSTTLQNVMFSGTGISYFILDTILQKYSTTMHYKIWIREDSYYVIIKLNTTLKKFTMNLLKSMDKKESLTCKQRYT